MQMNLFSVGMPEPFIIRVKAGETLNVDFTSIPDKVFEGKISEASYTLSSQSSTYPVIVLLTYPTQEIRQGMPADVTFHFMPENETEKFLASLRCLINTISSLCRRLLYSSLIKQEHNPNQVNLKAQFGQSSQEPGVRSQN